MSSGCRIQKSLCVSKDKAVIWFQVPPPFKCVDFFTICTRKLVFQQFFSFHYLSRVSWKKEKALNKVKSFLTLCYECINMEFKMCGEFLVVFEWKEFSLSFFINRVQFFSSFFKILACFQSMDDEGEKEEEKVLKSTKLFPWGCFLFHRIKRCCVWCL